MTKPMARVNLPGVSILEILESQPQKALATPALPMPGKCHAFEGPYVSPCLMPHIPHTLPLAPPTLPLSVQLVLLPLPLP